jgi:hypothetical protein
MKSLNHKDHEGRALTTKNTKEERNHRSKTKEDEEEHFH